MIDTLAAARSQWDIDRPRFTAFGELVALRVKAAVAARGIWCDVSSRAKEHHSLLKKLMRGKHTYASLADRVGARCIVRYRHEMETVVQVANEIFACGEVDRKSVGLGDKVMGYQSHHVQVQLFDGDASFTDYPSSEFTAELQVRTLAQHLWSEMSHDTFYKNEALAAGANIDLGRRINLMAGLIEVADREFERLAAETAEDPAVEVFHALEREYYKFASRRPDVELSLAIIAELLPTYGDDPKRASSLVASFVASHDAAIRHVYGEAVDDRPSLLLWQPEALMMYERLDHDEVEARIVLNRVVPELEVERLANAFGISFD